jgi:hypothetical protein
MHPSHYPVNLMMRSFVPTVELHISFELARDLLICTH